MTVRTGRTWVPSLDGTWAALAVLIPVAVTLSVRAQALDLAYQVRVGDEMLRALAVARSDTFTYTVYGHDWLNQQWGSQIGLATVHGLGGWVGLDGLRALLVATTMLLVYRACRASHAPPRTAAVLVLLGWLVSSVILAQLRPQSFAVVLFATVMWIVQMRERAGWRLGFVVLITCLWANTHGSFPLVFLLLGSAALADGLEKRWGSVTRVGVAALACAATTLLNPFGPRVWGYVVDLASNPVVSQRIGEWGPPSPRNLTGLLFWVSLVAAVSVVVARRDRFDVPTVLTLLLLGVVSMLAVRAVVWWAMAAPVLLARAFDAGHDVAERSSTRSSMNLAPIVCLVAFARVGLLRGSRVDPSTGAPGMLSFAPEHLVAAVREHVPAGSRVFASQFHASWAEYSAPANLYAVDSRIELFPTDVWDEYFLVSSGGDGWTEILDAAGVDALLLDPDQAGGLLSEVDDDPAWRLLLENGDGSAYVRT